MLTSPASRCIATVMFAILLSPVALSGPALAKWSAPMTVAGSVEPTSPSTAVNARGDLVIAWAHAGRVSSGRHPHVTVAVHVATRSWGTARYRSRTLMSARDLAVQGITVAIDPRGEATVAWVDEPDDNGLLHGHKTVRAAFRTSEGHWSAVQSIGRSGAFFYASPRLAATSDGTVALTYNAGVFGPSHVMSAWRSRGHRFGSLRPIAASSGLMDPNLAVDSGGVVYLVGTRNCDRSTSAGVLYTATARGRRFGTARVIAPGPAAHVQLSVLGRGSAVVAWLARSCNTTEDLTGAPMTAALRGATVTPPVRLDFAPATGITLAGAPRGADVSWTAFPINAPGGALLSSHVSAAGVPTVAQSPVDQWIAVAADSRGDQVMRRVSSPATTPLSPLAVRGATGAFELAPITGAGWPWTAGTTGAADGAALAAMTSASRRIVATVWRPTHP